MEDIVGLTYRDLSRILPYSSIWELQFYLNASKVFNGLSVSRARGNAV